MSSRIGEMILDRYHVEAFIGRGSAAEVYKVWDMKRASHLAMKLLREDLALDKVFLRRFQREAQTLQELQHPHIVRFYGLEQQKRLAFMLMEYVDGESLKHWLFDQNRCVSGEELLSKIRPICRALAYAHNSDIIHCDIKPANIMLNTNGNVLVADFGIARTTDASTATMIGFGTPAYMAPEQVRGQDPLPQTDLYALGVVLYEMVTGGERPFAGDTKETTGSTSERIRWEQLHRDPIPPRQCNPSLPADVEAVIMRCLAKQPEDRFDSALALLNALEITLAPAMEHTVVGEVAKLDKAVPVDSPIDDTNQSGQYQLPDIPPPTRAAHPPRPKTRSCLMIGLGLLLVGVCLAAIAGGVFLVSGVALWTMLGF